MEGHSTKYMTSTIQNVKVTKSEENLKNCYNQEEFKET